MKFYQMLIGIVALILLIVDDITECAENVSSVTEVSDVNNVTDITDITDVTNLSEITVTADPTDGIVSTNVPDVTDGVDSTGVTDIVGTDVTDVIDVSTGRVTISDAIQPPKLSASDHYLNRLNFLRMTERNCSVAYLEVHLSPGDILQRTTCVVGFWMQGPLPLWLHPVDYEGLLDTLARAPSHLKSNFTQQLCPCQNVEVAKECSVMVTDALLPLIQPCLDHLYDSKDNVDLQMADAPQKSLNKIQLFEKVNAMFNPTIQG